MLILAQHFVHEYHGETTLHPLGLAAVVILGAAMLAVPRRYAVWPMIVMACFVAPAQRIVIFGADFNLLRLMTLFGFIRILLKSETAGFRWRPLDTAVVTFALVHLTMNIIRIGPDVLMNKLGYVFDAVGMYLLFRVLVRNWDDIRSVTLGFTLVAIPVAACFILEKATGRNVFAIFGGVPEVTLIRNGRLRCQGAFAHPILAGVFWASLLPLLAAQHWDGPRGRQLARVGCVAALLIIAACSSATPVTGVMFACIAAVMYRYRYSLRTFRWGLVIVLFGLHMVMEAPVWHLVTRIDIVGGSSYHRYMLLDGAIRHWHEWWLVGSRVGTAHWGWYTHDVTNAYIVQAINGGVLLLVIFVGMIAIAFRTVGRTWRTAATRNELFWSWALGVSLFVHVTSFIGVSYFGQILMLWYLLLAMIGSTSSELLSPSTSKFKLTHANMWHKAAQT